MTKKQKKSLFEIIISAIIVILTLLLSLIGYLKETFFLERSIYFYLSLVLYLIAYFIVGRSVLIKSFKNILRGKVFDEFFLMSIATIVAFILGEFFEGVAVMLFYQVGELFQSIAVERSRKSITHLMDIAPSFAIRIDEDGKEEVIDPDEVNIDDVLLIKVGDKIPVDAIVIEGSTTIDTSSLTGESIPSDVKKDDVIISGCINLTSAIKVKAKTKYEDSTVYHILNLIEEANESKGKTEQFISKFAKYYTPAVVILAVLISIIPPLFNNYNFSEWIYKGLSFLVISCPCALVISIPLSFFSGIGKGSKYGILIKGGVHLENLAKIKTLFFDKTGTITTGRFKVTKSSLNENDTSLLASIEDYSNHPLSKAITSEYKSIERVKIVDLEEISGKGIKGKYNNQIVLCGNKALFDQFNIKIEEQEGTVIYLGLDDKYLGYVILEDEIKEDSFKALQELKKLNVTKRIMLTGDKANVAKKVSSKLEITDCYAELLPQEKLEHIKKEKNTKYKVGFVGDGINDAPSLAYADVSFAMGEKGASLALETSDIVLMDDSLTKVAKSIKIAKSTMRICYENIILALGIKLLCMILSVLGIGGILMSIFADVGVMILCVINSMRNLYSK